MKTENTYPFHQKHWILYILILFAASLAVVWWIQHTTPQPEIIDLNIATTQQKSNL